MHKHIVMIVLIGILVWLLFKKNEKYTSQDVQGLKEYLKAASNNPAANSAVLGDSKLLATAFSGGDFVTQLKKTMQDFPDSDTSSMQSNIETYLKSRVSDTVS
jgi:hypothetical protein